MDNDRHSYERDAIVGGLVGAGIYLLYRFIRKYWYVIPILLVFNKFRPDTPHEAASRFWDNSKISLGAVVITTGIPGSVKYTVINDSDASISNVRLLCKYKTKFDANSFDGQNDGSVFSEYNVDAVSPHSRSTRTVKLTSNGHVWNNMIDEKSWSCVPAFTFDKSEFYKNTANRVTTIESQVIVKFDTKVDPVPKGGYFYVIEAKGIFTNNSDKKIKKFTVSCDVLAEGNIVRKADNEFILDAAPHSSVSFEGKLFRVKDNNKAEHRNCYYDGIIEE